MKIIEKLKSCAGCARRREKLKRLSDLARERAQLAMARLLLNDAKPISNDLRMRIDAIKSKASENIERRKNERPHD